MRDARVLGPRIRRRVATVANALAPLLPELELLNVRVDSWFDDELDDEADAEDDD